MTKSCPYLLPQIWTEETVINRTIRLLYKFKNSFFTLVGTLYFEYFPYFTIISDNFSYFSGTLESLHAFWKRMKVTLLHLIKNFVCKFRVSKKIVCDIGYAL